MTFDETVNDIIATVKRADKIDDIRRAVNAAINFVTLSANWANDLVEETVAIDSAEYINNITLSDLTRFRKFEYIKPVGATYTIDPVHPNRAFKDNVEQIPCYYIAGRLAIVKTRSLYSSLNVGYYQYPTPMLEGDTDGHWMLDVFPYLIQERALVKIWSEIGNDKESKDAMAQFRIYYATALNDLQYMINPS